MYDQQIEYLKAYVKAAKEQVQADADALFDSQVELGIAEDELAMWEEKAREARDS